MSTLFDYIKSLLPKFGRDKVLELSRQTQSELNGFVVPSYVEAEKGIGSRNFSSVKIQEMTTVLKRNIKTDRPTDNIITIIRKSLEQISKNIQIVETYVGDSLEDEIVIAGVTVMKINLLRLIETTSFVTRYSGKLLNYIYILETAAVGGDTKYVEGSLSKGEILWLEERYLDYVIALAILSKNDKIVTSILKSLPEVAITEESTAAASTLGDTAIDPFGFKRLSNFTNNPIMHVGLIVAQYQAARYKEAKETKTILQLRLLNLKQQEKNTPNPKLEKEIEYIQRRVDRISDDIRKAEDES